MHQESNSNMELRTWADNTLGKEASISYHVSREYAAVCVHEKVRSNAALGSLRVAILRIEDLTVMREEVIPNVSAFKWEKDSFIAIEHPGIVQEKGGSAPVKHVVYHTKLTPLRF